MRWLQSGVTNDRERSYGKPCYQEMNREKFEAFLGSLPPKRRDELGRDWQLAFAGKHARGRYTTR